MNTTDIKYPEVLVQLSGNDGNAYSILAAVQSGLKRFGVSKDERDAFFEEATAGDYDALLQTCMRWVRVA
jgi:hypothetical protein